MFSSFIDFINILSLILQIYLLVQKVIRKLIFEVLNIVLFSLVFIINILLTKAGQFSHIWW